MAEAATATRGHAEGETRRDFIYLAAAGMGAVGAAAAAWPFIAFMNPSADVLALSTSEVDLKPVQEGMAITVTWRGKPVFVRRRTKAEIDTAAAVKLDDLPDPQADSARAKKPEWLILVGVCTHLGCVPLGQQGDFGGWFCPCHGSHYDTAGRIRKGPAPENLPVPAFQFISDTKIRIG